MRPNEHNSSKSKVMFHPRRHSIDLKPENLLSGSRRHHLGSHNLQAVQRSLALSDELCACKKMLAPNAQFMLLLNNAS